MKISQLLVLLPLVGSVCLAQMPSSFDASGRSAQAESGVQQEPSTPGENPPPQVFGMEVPLLDPASDTVKYNGGFFDVGNNAMVRARFEKYLEQNPDDSAESRNYCNRINSILDTTEEYQRGGKAMNTKILTKIARHLFIANDYPGDGGQSGVLASAIASAMNIQRANRARDRRNKELDEEIDSIVRSANILQNRNSMRRATGTGAKRPSERLKSNETRLTHLAQDATERKAEQVKNAALNEANLGVSKVNYQASVVSFFLQRRFDHAVIAARLYKHVFNDASTTLQLDKDSDAAKFFSGVTGMQPTVDTLDSAASNARREVDQSIDAVHNLLAQNKLGSATQRLIEAVAIGEYMQSVATFPRKSRQRIYEYWTLRKRALASMNARDYQKVMDIADKMRALDGDFDDSLLRSYCKGRMRQSDLAIRNAGKALMANDEEAFNRYLTEAGSIWPLNPNLDKSAEQLESYDDQDHVLAEFRTLMSRKDYRTIYNERTKFEAVGRDPELKSQYMEIIELIKTIDVLLEQMESKAQQDLTMGPCMAYEELLEFSKKDERYLADEAFRAAQSQYASKAHEFVQALEDARNCEEAREFGSAAACYFRASSMYPKSKLAKEGIERVTGIIISAQY